MAAAEDKCRTWMAVGAGRSCCTAGVGTAEVGTAEVGKAEVGSSELCKGGGSWMPASPGVSWRGLPI